MDQFLKKNDGYRKISFFIIENLLKGFDINNPDAILSNRTVY